MPSVTALKRGVNRSGCEKAPNHKPQHPKELNLRIFLLALDKLELLWSLEVGILKPYG